MSNKEWIGGKKIYGSSEIPSDNDNWLDQFTDEELGIGGCGFKPAKNSFKVETEQEEKEEDE